MDFLLSPNATIYPFGIGINITNKDTLDVRRPVINEVATGSAALAALNAAIGYLPENILYGEIVYDKADLGYLKQDHWWSAYSVFTGGWFVGPSMSTPAQNGIIGAAYFPSDFSGDGLIPYQNQYFTIMGGFPGFGITPLTNISDDVLHAQATHRTGDLNTQLHALEPTWFP